MTTRRNFIRQAAILSSGLVANSSFGAFNIGKKPKVIIIGAGFAGLTAAYYLHKKNIEYTLLESRDRIGGRVFSHTIDEKDKLVVELGAEWVGASHKRLIGLTKEMGLTLENNQFDTNLIYRGVYNKNTDWDYSPQWKNKFESLLKNYHHLTEKDKVIVF